MAFDISYADVLALGESDEEDPVILIGEKQKRAHKKAQSSVMKVRLDVDYFAPPSKHICFPLQEIKQSYNIFVQKTEHAQVPHHSFSESTLNKKRRKRGGRKNKGARKSTFCFNAEEEMKVPPATADDAYFLAELFDDSEETKAADAFIAKYHQEKVKQNFNDQEVMSDIEEERYYGNTEYKLMLSNKSADRIARLTTQMKFRMQEGNGEAFYVIGVADSGEAVGIPAQEMEESLRTLFKMSTSLNAELFIRSVNKARNGEIVKVRVV